MSNSGNEDDAQDIFQDAVIVVYKQFKTNQLDENVNVEAYLLTVAKNRWINKAKRSARIRLTESLPENEHVESNIFDLLISHEREVLVKGVLGQLGEQCLKLLNLIFYQGYALSEATELMQFKSSEVTHTVHYRCKKKLKALVGENVTFKNILKNHG